MTLLKTNKILTKSSYRLSVQVSLTGLSFLVLDLEKQETVFFSEKTFGGTRSPEEVLLEIQEIIDKTEVLQSNFLKVSVVFANNIYTVVPTTLFDESKLSEYLKFNSKMLANDYITFDSIDNHEMVVVYVPYVNITNYFFDRYGTFQYYHSASIFLKTILDSEKHTIVPKVYVHVQDNSFDCIVLRESSLQLCNTYSYRTPEDFIYYVLFCLEQLNLNPDKVIFYLCGDIAENDNIYNIVYKYIRNVKFVDMSTFAKIDITEKDNHRHFILKHSL